MGNSSAENNCKFPSPPAEAHYTVYKLTDPEGKVYIGCTGKSVEERWKKGWNYNSKSLIFKAIRTIGWENFEKKILCENLTREGAEKLEKWFIAFYASADPDKGYNRALGGLGKGSRFSEASRALCRYNTKNLYANDPSYRERVKRAVLEAHARPEYARSQRVLARRFYEEHPEKRAERSRWMKEYLSRPENRVFVESSSRPKPVVCVETGEVYRSQRAAERATGFKGIHLVCSGRKFTSGGCHWRYAEE